MQVLITGGAGYLGSILSRKLLAEDHDVKVIDALWYGKEPVNELLDNKNFKLVHDDIRNLISVGKEIRGMDAVVHLASVVGMPASNIDPKLSEEINYLATKNIAELCELHGIENYVFASSCSVYGSQPDRMITEKSPIQPVDRYAESKFKSERAINWLYNGACILRFGTLFGWSYRMRYDLVVNLFAAQALNDGVITVNGGNQFRPFLNVEDAARSIIHALDKNLDGVYNVIFDNKTIMSIAKFIQQKTGCEINTSEGNDNRDYKVSSAKIRNTGYKTTKGFDTILHDLTNDADCVNYQDKKYSNYKTLYDLDRFAQL